MTEWRTVLLGDVCEVASGGTPSRDRPSYWNGGIPWVTTSRIDYALILFAEETISEDGLRNSSSKVFPAGTLLMAMYGQVKTRGRVAVLGIDAAINQACLAITPKATVDTTYLFNYLSHQYANIRRMAHGSNQDNLSAELIKTIRIPLPSIGEQRRIASILSTWDRAIEQTERLIAAKRRRKQALMQQLLTGKRRFKEFVRSRAMRDTHFGPIPADWRVVRIGDVADVNKQSLSENTAPQYEFLYLDVSAIKQGRIEFPSERIRFENAPSRARRIPSRGDVIMSTVRPYLLGFALADFDTTEVVCSTGFALISTRDACDAQFLYQSLYSRHIMRQVEGQLSGSNYPAITSADVERLTLPFPSQNGERSKIGDVLALCDREMGALSQKLETLKRQKKGLMQELLTGRVRAKCEG